MSTLSRAAVIIRRFHRQLPPCHYTLAWPFLLRSLQYSSVFVKDGKCGGLRIFGFTGQSCDDQDGMFPNPHLSRSVEDTGARQGLDKELDVSATSCFLFYISSIVFIMSLLRLFLLRYSVVIDRQDYA